MGQGLARQQAFVLMFVEACLWYLCGSFAAGVAFTRQGSHVRSMYHPPWTSSTCATSGWRFALGIRGQV